MNLKLWQAAAHISWATGCLGLGAFLLVVDEFNSPEALPELRWLAITLVLLLGLRYFADAMNLVKQAGLHVRRRPGSGSLRRASTQSHYHRNEIAYQGEQE